MFLLQNSLYVSVSNVFTITVDHCGTAASLPDISSNLDRTKGSDGF